MSSKQSCVSDKFSKLFVITPSTKNCESYSIIQYRVLNEKWKEYKNGVCTAKNQDWKLQQFANNITFPNENSSHSYVWFSYKKNILSSVYHENFKH